MARVVGATIVAIGGVVLIASCDGVLVRGEVGEQAYGPRTPGERGPGSGTVTGAGSAGMAADGGVGASAIDGGPAGSAPASAPADSCGRCGNEVVDCGESCDDGNELVERCADPRVDPNAERVRVCGTTCRWTLCDLPRCGDEIVDGAAGEQCDEGVAATRTCAGCQLTLCGQQPDLQAFDDDYDCDGFADAEDNCPRAVNPDQADSDGDGVGDVCEARECTDSLCGPPEESGGGSGGCGCGAAIIIGLENDGYHYVDDYDADGFEDGFDNCPLDANTTQTDADGDGVGDACDPESCPSQCVP